MQDFRGAPRTMPHQWCCLMRDMFFEYAFSMLDDLRQYEFHDDASGLSPATGRAHDVEGRHSIYFAHDTLGDISSASPVAYQHHQQFYKRPMHVILVIGAAIRLLPGQVKFHTATAVALADMPLID